MIICPKKTYNTNTIYAKSFYPIKIANDFLFFSFILKEYIRLHVLPSLNSLTTTIYLLNILAIKYLLFTTYISTFARINSSSPRNQAYSLELLFWSAQKILTLNIKAVNNIEQKILCIKKISRTRERGRIRRYKVIVLVGNKSGWFGIGSSKSYYLQEALSSARTHAFKNIYHLPVFYSQLLKNKMCQKQRARRLYLFSSMSKLQSPAHYVLRVLFDFAGITNIRSKVIRIDNIYNILSLILTI